jgi:hypothetical protein
MGLCATDAEFMNDIMRWFIFLNRHGKAFQHFRGKIEPEIMRMTIDKEIDYDPDAEVEENKDRNGPRRSRLRAQMDHLPADLQE